MNSKHDRRLNQIDLGIKDVRRHFRDFTAARNVSLLALSNTAQELERALFDLRNLIHSPDYTWAQVHPEEECDPPTYTPEQLDKLVAYYDKPRSDGTKRPVW
jgi:hypothetical protein